MPKSKTSLSRKQERELRRLCRFYRREAERCAAARAYLAGCVMLGSAAECMLILFTDAYFDEALQGAAASSTLLKKKLDKKPFARWSLADFIDVARESGWLKTGLKQGVRFRNQKPAQIGDYVDLLRSVRNLVHPLAYAEDHCGKRITKKYFDFCDEILSVAIDWLEEKVHADLWPVVMPGVPRGRPK